MSGHPCQEAHAAHNIKREQHNKVTQALLVARRRDEELAPGHDADVDNVVCAMVRVRVPHARDTEAPVAFERDGAPDELLELVRLFGLQRVECRAQDGQPDALHVLEDASPDRDAVEEDIELLVDLYATR